MKHLKFQQYATNMIITYPMCANIINVGSKDNEMTAG